MLGTGGLRNLCYIEGRRDVMPGQGLQLQEPSPPDPTNFKIVRTQRQEVALWDNRNPVSQLWLWVLQPWVSGPWRGVPRTVFSVLPASACECSTLREGAWRERKSWESCAFKKNDSNKQKRQ